MGSGRRKAVCKEPVEKKAVRMKQLEKGRYKGAWKRTKHVEGIAWKSTDTKKRLEKKANRRKRQENGKYIEAGRVENWR